MEDYKKLVERLRGDTDCDSCGLSGECSHESCLLETKAADAIENLQTENAALRRHIDNLTSAQAVMVKEFMAKLEELDLVKAERDAEAALARKDSTVPEAPQDPAEPEWKIRVMRTFLGGR